MIKNFSHAALGINGRQSELIELALTYGFTGMDIDMQDMLRRSQRTDIQDASKYLEAAKIKIGGFDLGIDLDADEESFTGIASSIAYECQESERQQCLVRRRKEVGCLELIQNALRHFSICNSASVTLPAA